MCVWITCGHAKTEKSRPLNTFIEKTYINFFSYLNCSITETDAFTEAVHTFGYGIIS